MSQRLTTKALAERLGLEPKTIYNWRIAGKGPRFIKNDGRNGKVSYRIEDVEQWEKDRIKEPTT